MGLAAVRRCWSGGTSTILNWKRSLPFTVLATSEIYWRVVGYRNGTSLLPVFCGQGRRLPHHWHPEWVGKWELVCAEALGRTLSRLDPDYYSKNL